MCIGIHGSERETSYVGNYIASTDSSHKVAPNTAMEVNHTTIYRSCRTQ